jgi:putative flavoprotein involved in K+ transport
MESRRTTVVVIGAGPAGLATSWHLTGHGIDHVVLERGVVANAWRHERWDSLRLLTPNWMSLLPGDEPHDDAHGFMTATQVADRFENYQRRHLAPVRTATTVTSIRPGTSGFNVDTDDGPWQCAGVVVATGASGAPRVPAIAEALPRSLTQVTAHEYRRPCEVGDREVLVVGASASGVQIADELVRAGRQVTLAVGDHVRLPRAYRGRDIYWWMHAIGLLDERDDQVVDLARARRLPSAQLVGSSTRDVDLGALSRRGVSVVGRLVGIDGHDALFSGGLRTLVLGADLKMRRLLDRIDAYVDAHPGVGDVEAADRPELTVLPEPATRVGLDRFDSVVWATGHRPVFSALPTGVLDRTGRLRHRRGVVELPGLYTVGQPVMRTRRSGLIAGIGQDASSIAAELAQWVGRGFDAA